MRTAPSRTSTSGVTPSKCARTRSGIAAPTRKVTFAAPPLKSRLPRVVSLIGAAKSRRSSSCCIVVLPSCLFPLIRVSSFHSLIAVRLSYPLSCQRPKPSWVSFEASRKPRPTEPARRRRYTSRGNRHLLNPLVDTACRFGASTRCPCRSRHRRGVRWTPDQLSQPGAHEHHARKDDPESGQRDGSAHMDAASHARPDVVSIPDWP